MAGKDLYAVIGVDKNATEQEIRKEYRRKARELHPDVNKAPDAEEKFKELNEAYDVLSDEKKRAQYDRFGTIPGAAGGGAGGPGYVDFDEIFGGGGGFDGFGDVFSSFFSGFGASAGKRVRKEGHDMQIGLRITLEEVATGCKKEVIYERLAPCEDCHGTGMGPNGKEVKCDKCNGTGRVVSVTRTFLGDMQTATTCDACNGTGTKIDNPCPECGGQGRVPDRQRVTVEIPSGIQDGQQLRVSGYGEAGMQGAMAGDLLVTIRIQRHDYYERHGNDLHVSLAVPMVQAALGATLEVDGILEDEVVDVKIPEGTQTGDKIRVKGYGLPKFRGSGRGDMIMHTKVEIPKKLKKKEREILESLAKEMGEETADTRSPLEKLRDAFN
ncbi:MAG: molecular chaperone DnaJ [Phoenicibacter congonensis]|uniref:Chaperone protein DnaJ n=1 Tax=Phoenicibacter congonensis TaxID=1944646 RepID=A0AA43RH54_9ACTN|nr:molecular chaperone DnaJ [Phoenicibacter congonensis]